MRLATMLVTGVLLAGCGLPPGGPVRLLTWSPGGWGEDGGCFLASTTGTLAADATYGTTIVDMVGQVEGPPGRALALAWRPGFTARRVGGEIEVLDPDGHVVATTGQRYFLEGGNAEIDGTEAFWSCGTVNPR